MFKKKNYLLSLQIPPPNQLTKAMEASHPTEPTIH